MNEFLQAYIEAALWSSNDESTEAGGQPMDASYGAEDFAPETMERFRKDCEDFLDAATLALIGDRVTLAGHDFWLTRNGHGSGFWDGDWPEDAGHLLTERAHQFGEIDLYVGDDEKLYC